MTLPSVLCALLLLLLLPAAQLPSAAARPVARQAMLTLAPGNLLAEFERLGAGSNEEVCPRVIEHTAADVAADTGIVTVQHSNIRMDGQCTSPGPFVIVPPEQVTSLPEVQELLAGNADAAAALQSLLEMVDGNLLVGLERTGRSCVGGTFPPNTLFFFSRLGLRVPELAGAFIGDIDLGDTVMSVLSLEGDGISCTYVNRASRIPATPGPSPSPAGGGAGGSGNAESAGEDDPVCFPASAVVTLRDGRRKPIAALELGDAVQVGRDEHSEVFLFTHRQAQTWHDFVELTTASAADAPLTASAGHYLYLNSKLAPAAAARVGDVLTRADGSAAVIAQVRTVRARGLYNPQTLHGDIVVDGFRVSTYTTAVQPRLADTLLAPLRGLHRLGARLDTVSRWFDGEAVGALARWMMPSGRKVNV